MEEWLQLQERRNQQNLQLGQSLDLEWKRDVQLWHSRFAKHINSSLISWEDKNGEHRNKKHLLASVRDTHTLVTLHSSSLWLELCGQGKIQLFDWWRREQDSERRELHICSALHTHQGPLWHLDPVTKCSSRQHERRRVHMLNFTVHPSFSVGYVHTTKLMAERFLLLSLISSSILHEHRLQLA